MISAIALFWGKGVDLGDFLDAGGGICALVARAMGSFGDGFEGTTYGCRDGLFGRDWTTYYIRDALVVGS